MCPEEIVIRQADPVMYADTGRMMVRVYAQLEGFPKEEEQPAYYAMLANVGAFTQKPGVELLVAVTGEGSVLGGVVYFSDMQYYGSGGTATLEKDAAGFRLLAVDPAARGLGLGKKLTLACIRKAIEQGRAQVIIHSTRSMQTAWSMYTKLGFERSEDLDFMQGALPVFGFRLKLAGAQAMAVDG